MGVHLFEETKPLAAAVDLRPRACYALCLGAGPLDPNGLLGSQEGRALVRGRFVLPVRSEGGGFRPTAKRAQFLSTPNNECPKSLATGHTRGLWPSLDSVFGAGSFSAEYGATSWEVCSCRVASACR